MESNNLQYIGGLFGKACKDVVIKCIATAGLVMTEFFIDDVMNKAMAALLFLILFDSITGVLAAKRIGDKIRSAKLVRSAIKIAVYFMLVASGRIAEYSLPDFAGYLDETVMAFLVLTEFISILENVGKMGYAIPKVLLNKLRSIRDEK